MAPPSHTSAVLPLSSSSSDERQNEASIENGKVTADDRLEHEQTQYPPFKIVFTVAVGLYIALFLVSLDKMIIATAVPKITDEFNSLDDVGWYGSAYLLANCATQLFYGRVYTFYSPKWVFMSGLLFFEVGSALCGAAPNSISFIIGRAIAGVGTSGVTSGVIVILIPLVPLRKRPMLQGLVGAVFGISAVIGPLLGGAFTRDVTWRWCFWINLPCGAVSALVILFLLKAQPPLHAGASTREKIQQLDPLGTVAFLSAIICLVLGLQWGGTTYAWSDGPVIALLVLFGVLIIAFVAIQWWQQENATIRPRIFLQRSIASGFIYAVCVGAGMLALGYFMPIWFQAIKGASAVRSGIMTLPYILALVVGSIFGGGGVQKAGYYTPFMIASSCMMSIGAGLMTTWRVDTNHQKWIGYQVLFGFGQGFGMQQPSLAAQAVLRKADVPVGASLMLMGQSLGGAISVAVAQNVFAQALVKDLTGVTASNPSDILNTGATVFRTIVPAQDLGRVLVGYNKAIIATFWVVVGVSCFSALPASLMEWVNIKVVKEQLTEEEKREEDAEK